MEEFDGSLIASAKILASAVEYDDGKIEIEFHSNTLAKLRSDEKAVYFQFWEEGGGVFPLTWPMNFGHRWRASAPPPKSP